jgi:hypothetical protein
VFFGTNFQKENSKLCKIFLEAFSHQSVPSSVRT